MSPFRTDSVVSHPITTSRFVSVFCRFNEKKRKESNIKTDTKENKKKLKLCFEQPDTDGRMTDRPRITEINCLLIIKEE